MKAYLTLSHGDESLGNLRLSLRPDIVPKTVDNFAHFLTTHKTVPPGSKGYHSSTFHRIIPKFMAQGGDFLRGDGTGSTSIYGPSFADENFVLSHSQRGTLSMANSGGDTNGCQFFITFRPTAHLDGKHVVFGYVDWREDAESARVLDALEKVRTGRNDRPVVPVVITDCGIVDEKKYKKTEDGGEKLSGEAKKNKLLRAYGDNPADEDEIDLDENEDEANGEAPAEKAERDAAVPHNEEEIDIEDENDEPAEDLVEEAPTSDKPTSKKAALQKRLAALRTKINQSRTLNRREVHAEAKRMGTEEATSQERRRQNKQDKNTKQKEYETYVVGKLKSVGESNPKSNTDDKAEQKRLAALAQPAYESIRKMNAKADKMERNQYGPDDYYNPEGQYNHYERNLKSVRHNARGKDVAASDSYDPTMVNHGPVDTSSEKAGAKRLADEMKRRAEKRANKRGRPEFDAYDVSYINERNKRFNEKISRNFDEHTAEIRQNLERGTAL